MPQGMRTTLTRWTFAAAPPALAAGLGGIAARDAPEIYRRLRKPSWAPPSEVFGPVWSVLYALIGVAGWRLAKRPNRTAVTVHLTQIALNASWTPLFFGAGSRRAALGVSIGLDMAILGEVVLLARHDKITSALLLPYLGWSGFATALTAAVSEPDPATAG